MFSRNPCARKVLRIALRALTAFLCVACGVSEDKTAAENAARRVHSSLQVGDFATVYKNAAPRLKSASTESEFTEYFKEIEHDFGSLKEAHEIAYESRLDSRIGRTHALLFDLEYERGRLYETLILIRSDGGEMQLWKLGIGSEPPKNWASE